MGRGTQILGAESGLEFSKLLGTGGGNGFSILPNFKKYALFTVWCDEAHADAFIKENSALKWYFDNSSDYLVVKMVSIKSHGTWGGINPFVNGLQLPENSPLAVVTRATIRPSKLHEFWWNVPSVSKFMAAQKSALYRVGIGEYPLMMQATLSIWKNEHDLMAAAYSDTVHAEIVKKTRDRKWYSEELFARFRPVTIAYRGGQYSKLTTISGQVQISGSLN